MNECRICPEYVVACRHDPDGLWLAVVTPESGHAELKRRGITSPCSCGGMPKDFYKVDGKPQVILYNIALAIKIRCCRSGFASSSPPVGYPDEATAIAAMHAWGRE